MKRAICTIIAVLAVSLAVVAAGACGDDETASKQAPVDTTPASPSDAGPSGPLSGEAWALDSGSQAYDPQLGGIYQAVGLEAFESGDVRVTWVADTGTAGTPMGESRPKPGVLDVWLSDVRPHIDLMEPLEVGGGPIESVAFVAPADDALMILRITMRDASATPDASILVSGEDGSGTIDVVLDD